MKQRTMSKIVFLALCIFLQTVPDTSAFLTSPLSLQHRRGATRYSGGACVRKIQCMSDGGNDDKDKEKRVPPLVPPPGSFENFGNAGKGYALPAASESNLDFVSELIVGNLDDGKDDTPLDGDVSSDPISVPVGGGKVELGEVVRPMMSMIFTCNVCETRQMRSFTRLAYEKGIVIVTCKGCASKHLIADNLGWYRDWLEKGDQNIQDIMKRKGVDVERLAGEDAYSLYEEWKE